MEMAKDESTGSVGFGILATIIGLAVMGFVPLVGWLFPGIFGGLAARGKARGLVSALIGAGIVITIAIEFALYIVPNTYFVNILTTYTGNSLVTKYVLIESAYVKGLMTTNLYAFLGKAVSNVLIIPGLGGLIGGSILGYTKDTDGY
jgi:hypothetical protein